MSIYLSLSQNQFDVYVLLEKTGSRNVSAAIHWEVFEKTTQQLNEGELKNITQINGTILDTQSSPSIESLAQNTIIPDTKKIVCIGPTTSSQTMKLLSLDRSHLIMSFSATSARIKAVNNNFIRVIPNDIIQVKSTIKLILSMNWTQIAVIKTIDQYGNDLYNGLKEECEKYNITILETLETDTTEFEPTFYKLQKLKNIPIIYVVVTYPLTKRIIQWAKDFGLNSEKYAWIFSEGAVSQLQNFLEDSEDLKNWFATILPFDMNMNESMDTILSPYRNLYSYYMYDALQVLGIALKNLTLKGEEISMMNLRDKILGLNITGLTGNISFTPDGERISGYYIITADHRTDRYDKFFHFDFYARTDPHGCLEDVGGLISPFPTSDLLVIPEHSEHSKTFSAWISILLSVVIFILIIIMLRLIEMRRRLKPKFL